MTATAVSTLSAVRSVAEQVLDAFAASAQQDGAGDPGPAILATVVAGAAAGPHSLTDGTPASRAMLAWLGQLRRPAPLGLFGGGAAGRMLAMRLAAGTWPRLDHPAGVLRARLTARAAAASWAASELSWTDYDLITGPSGVLLAFAADPAISAAQRAPLIGHLTRLCARDDLAGLRVGQYRGEELRGWNFGRINLGLAHGLPGVAAALRAAADADGLAGAVERPLRRLAGRLIDEAFTDSRGVITWGAGSRDGQPTLRASGRQAWCYGCPGIAWTLWEAGRVLGDDRVSAFAARAASSFIAACDSDAEDLGICHGVAGLLLVFDAFSRHADLPGAQHLADRLAGRLAGRLEALGELAVEDCSLQSGATGALAALLTVHGGDRRWLAAAGLR